MQITSGNDPRRNAGRNERKTSSGAGAFLGRFCSTNSRDFDELGRRAIDPGILIIGVPREIVREEDKYGIAENHSLNLMCWKPDAARVRIVERLRRRKLASQSWFSDPYIALIGALIPEAHRPIATSIPGPNAELTVFGVIVLLLFLRSVLTSHLDLLGSSSVKDENEPGKDLWDSEYNHKIR
ncbi:hypothetical protein WN55_00777 [Dufourea novaeangliae]|uniref:Uncharacterized protein n=1 Tax=Dufourea novaeangliae TaxID=178035 RepID=A0A154PE06_DUFNO|nr:hypothetical protein WN55_00777 [Dufourea novaeangliae]